MPATSSAAYSKYFADKLAKAAKPQKASKRERQENLREKLKRAARKEILRETVNTVDVCVQRKTSNSVALNDDVKRVIGTFLDPAPKRMSAGMAQLLVDAHAEQANAILEEQKRECEALIAAAVEPCVDHCLRDVKKRATAGETDCFSDATGNISFAKINRLPEAAQPALGAVVAIAGAVADELRALDFTVGQAATPSPADLKMLFIEWAKEE